MSQSSAIRVTDPSGVGEVRRLAAGLAQQLGFNETACGKVSVVATESASNLIRHAQRGQVFLRLLNETGRHGLEILAMDKGPGMYDLQRSMVDGYSTAGSPGTGLGAMARLSNVFDVYSKPEFGTVLLARFWQNGIDGPPPALEVGAICAPKDGEQVCGDAWSVRHEPDRTLIAVADGLGHGHFASQAAKECLRVFEERPGRSPSEIIQAAHGPLRPTRGASFAVSEINFSNGIVRYAGVGNISGTILSDGISRSMISHNGTVGHEMRRVQEFHYPWPADATLVMHSDGLQARWGLEAYAGLIVRHPSLIAGTLYRDFQREHDDTTVVVARKAI